jgi:Flp pilus assembly protein TadB
MSTQSNPPEDSGYGWGGYHWGGGPYRGRGFSPLFRGVYSDQHLRVSDAERQAVADRLSEHFAAGRLDQAEFDDRIGRAMGAKTRADLGGLFADLPETGAPAVHEHPYRRRRHPVLLLALFVVAAVAAAHVLWWTAGPLLWLGFFVIVVLFASRTFGGRSRADRSRAGQDR